MAYRELNHTEAYKNKVDYQKTFNPITNETTAIKLKETIKFNSINAYKISDTLYVINLPVHIDNYSECKFTILNDTGASKKELIKVFIEDVVDFIEPKANEVVYINLYKISSLVYISTSGIDHEKDSISFEVNGYISSLSAADYVGIWNGYNNLVDTVNSNFTDWNNKMNEWQGVIDSQNQIIENEVESNRIYKENLNQEMLESQTFIQKTYDNTIKHMLKVSLEDSTIGEVIDTLGGDIADHNGLVPAIGQNLSRLDYPELYAYYEKYFQDNIIDEDTLKVPLLMDSDGAGSLEIVSDVEYPGYGRVVRYTNGTQIIYGHNTVNNITVSGSLINKDINFPAEGQFFNTEYKIYSLQAINKLNKEEFIYPNVFTNLTVNVKSQTKFSIVYTTGASFTGGQPYTLEYIAIGSWLNEAKPTNIFKYIKAKSLHKNREYVVAVPQKDYIYKPYSWIIYMGRMYISNKETTWLGFLNENDWDEYTGKFIYRYRGSLASFQSIPDMATPGDVYFIKDENKSYAYMTEGTWGEVSTGFDMTKYYTKEEIDNRSISDLTASLYIVDNNNLSIDTPTDPVSYNLENVSSTPRTISLQWINNEDRIVLSTSRYTCQLFFDLPSNNEYKFECKWYIESQLISEGFVYYKNNTVSYNLITVPMAVNRIPGSLTVLKDEVFTLDITITKVSGNNGDIILHSSPSQSSNINRNSGEVGANQIYDTVSGVLKTQSQINNEMLRSNYIDNIITMTMAEYKALATIDPKTLYIIL